MESKPRRHRNSIRRIRPGNPIPLSKPSRYTTSDGYVILRWKVGVRSYIETLEHRIIDGYVTTARHVHHINHDRSDNRQTNLEGLSPKEHSQRHHITDWAEAWQLYEQGHSTTEVGNRLGCSAGHISRGLRKQGHTLRDTATGRRLILDNERIVELFLAGMPPRRIGALLGVGDWPIRRILRSEGISPRRPGRPLQAASERANRVLGSG